MKKQLEEKDAAKEKEYLELLDLKSSRQISLDIDKYKNEVEDYKNECELLREYLEERNIEIKALT